MKSTCTVHFLSCWSPSIQNPATSIQYQNCQLYENVLTLIFQLLYLYEGICIHQSKQNPLGRI